MSKAVKKVVGVVAAIAIPFAAPAIAGALGVSKAVGAAIGVGAKAASTIGSALVGAGLGAASAAVTGQDIGRGALFGGLGGGIGGFTQATAAANAAGATGGAGGAGVSGAGGIYGYGQAAGPGAFQPIQYSGFTPAAGTALNLVPATAGLATGTAGAGTAGGVTGGAGATGGATAGPSFMEALKSVPTAIAQKFSDPNALADLTLRAAGQLAGSAMAGDGLSAEERSLLNAQVQDLQRIREQDESLFRTRVEQAMAFLGEAKYFDPQYFGLKAQQEVQLAGAQQMREAERAAALTPGRGGMSAADVRRAGLDITARGQSAYLRGAEGAQQQRLQAYQSGLAQLPQQAPSQTMGLSSTLMNQYAEADRRRRELAGDIGDFFGSLTGTRQATTIG